MFKKIKEKIRKIEDILIKNLPYTEEIEANQCFQCANEIFKKTYEELKQRGEEQRINDQVDCCFKDDVDDDIIEVVFDLIMNYVHKYQSLPMYGMEFLIPDPIEDNTIVAIIDYVFPPEYSIDRILFSLNIEIEYRD